MPAFVVAAEEEDGIRVPDLERPQIEYTLHSRLDKAADVIRSLWTHLDAEVPSINIISQEKISGSGGIPANLEKFHKVILAGGSVVGAEWDDGPKRTYCP